MKYARCINLCIVLLLCFFLSACNNGSSFHTGKYKSLASDDVMIEFDKDSTGVLSSYEVTTGLSWEYESEYLNIALNNGDNYSAFVSGNYILLSPFTQELHISKDIQNKDLFSAIVFIDGSSTESSTEYLSFQTNGSVIHNKNKTEITKQYKRDGDILIISYNDFQQYLLCYNHSVYLLQTEAMLKRE